MKRSGFLIIVFSIVLYCLPATSQQSVRITQPWEFLRSDLGGIWEAVRPAAAGSPESVPIWQQVTLPHCFNACDAVDPDENYYQGPGWYRTMLDFRNPYANGHTLLHFEGAGQKTAVYIYTTKVASHTGGYDEWTADLTTAIADFLKSPEAKRFKGKVPVSIRCDNSRDLEMIPSSMSDFNVYGGLYRYVNIVYAPALSFETFHVQAQTDAAGKGGELTISASFSNYGNTTAAKLELCILDPQHKTVREIKLPVSIAKGKQQLACVSLKKPFLWSPGQPQLYTVQAKLITDTDTAAYSTHTGFRHFEFIKRGPFLLNGKRLLLRGTHRHEDHAGVAAATTEDMIRREMIMIKQMGANFIRLGHYQQSRTVLDMCDSLGILVWEEIPWCRGGLGGDIYKEQARRMLRNMLSQHYNHPAVILWGLGNENDWPGDFPEFSKEKIRSFMSELNTMAHQLDSTRKTTIRRCDFCKDIVDVYSPSIWAGWYRGRYTEYKQESLSEIAKVPHFFHAEWGADSHQGRFAEEPEKFIQQVVTGKGTDERTGDFALTGGNARASKDGDWSESYAVNLVDWHLKEQETMPQLTGTAYWVFKDFSTPLRPENPVPYVNQKGIVARDLTPKEIFYVFRSYWAEELMAHIYGHNTPVRWGREGEEKEIRVYSNGPEAELWVNGKSLGIRKRNSQDFPAAGLRWKTSLNNGVNQIKVIARNGKQTVTDTLNWQYQTAQWSKPVKLLVESGALTGNIFRIRVKAVDINGVLCLDAANLITFSQAGNSILRDDLGTVGGSRKVQLANGMASIDVEAGEGTSVIAATSVGLESGLAIIKYHIDNKTH
ncbi:MAG TPA: glycoside hydrolase family 2 TIM barrel-domain containing protein [Chitinophaga sp.]|uniref:glycoside hydrolase family 2 TIM barrel-domain containing protein n=1 Tax=Chitinophaga sp. TaxID=1869181 RepID=UPI002B764721|nr:glycoside hydrolase family 2 TIM barrel-domain containing protein [Chitinophaga sp.]HVI46800.1 glycoside hydrolase family 2 TIM barrel-domain containing protein [Chitinophaga sp.]